MNVDELIQKLKITEEYNVKLEQELQLTKEHLKKYTAPASSKIYYEKHKELVKERVKKCREKTIYKSTPEQRKEYNKQAYLRRKEKLQKELEEKGKGENI
jgi:hypothetical protein